MRRMLSLYGWDLGFATVAGFAVFLSMGLESLVRYLILGVMEVSFSFDNAIVNVAVLVTMTVAWQRRFMTWGFVIAVLGMRLVFPIAIVSVTAHLNPVDVVRLAIWQPHLYTDKLDAARVPIAVLGGVYLLLIFLNFVFEERGITWISFIELRLAKAGKLDMLPFIVVGSLLLALYEILRDAHVLAYGIASMTLFAAVSAISNFFESKSEENQDVDEAVGPNTARSGTGGFAVFVLLAIQDASFSFDGVSGSFTVTKKIFLIVVALAVGAKFVYSMTNHLLQTQKIGEYIYLEHGAYWSIGALGVYTMVTLLVNLPSYIPNILTVLFLGSALLGSVRYNKLHPASMEDPEVPADEKPEVSFAKV